MDVIRPTYMLFWEGATATILAVIICIPILWRIITPEMRKEVINVVDRWWRRFKQDAWKDLDEECPHRRPHY